MKKVSLLLAISILTIAATSADAQNLHGKVKKEGTRLARPAGVIESPKLQLQTDGFMLNSNLYKVNTQAAESWNPYAELRPRAQWQQAPQNQLSGNTAVQPDYNAIEQAYAEVGKYFVPAQVAQTSHSNGIAASPIFSSPFAMQAAAAGRLTMSGNLAVTPQEAAAGTFVDDDHCQCNAPMPTTECVQSRMQGFGTNINTTPRLTVPGSAPMVAAPRMMGRHPAFTFNGR